MVTSVDVYKEIRRLQLEGITSQRAAAKRLGISRNTVKKYWEGNAVPWNRKEYSREAAVMTLDVVQFISVCLDEDDRERVKKQKHKMCIRDRRHPLQPLGQLTVDALLL